MPLVSCKSCNCARTPSLWNVLPEGYGKRVVILYSAWFKKVKAGKGGDLDGTVMKAKSLLGAYAEMPSLFLKRCQWLVEQSLWDATFINAREVATALVAHNVPGWKLLHIVTEEELVKWFRDDQCLALLRPVVDKLKVTNALEYREVRSKRRRLAVVGEARVIPGAVVLGLATGEHLLTLQTCLRGAAGDLCDSDRLRSRRGMR